METRLLAETIYSAVVHGQGTKRQTIDKIASMLEADRVARAEHVSNSYKFPEPRTCETCGTGCSNRGAKVFGLDLNESKSCPEWTPRSPQSADVETARSKIVLAIKFGLPIDARMALRDALAALDRIVGKEE